MKPQLDVELVNTAAWIIVISAIGAAVWFVGGLIGRLAAMLT